MEPTVAVRVLPTALPVARPVAATTVTALPLDDQVTPLVSGALVPSEYSPVALNCCVRPTATVAVSA